MSDDLVKRLRSEYMVASRTEAADRLEELEAKLAKAVEALRKLHHSVCGETGFASCVRMDSGKAYPWPALAEADELARTTLAAVSETHKLKGENQ